MKRITVPAASVLQAISQGSNYGFTIMEATGLSSGTVYQVLRRFERYGLVRSRWERGDPSEAGRPRRRYYELTEEGTTTLARAAATCSRRVNPFVEQVVS